MAYALSRSLAKLIQQSLPLPSNAEIANQLAPEMKSRFPGLQVRLAGAGLDQTRDLQSLGQMMSISMLVIFLLLASQLRTYTLPFVVLAGVPFGAAGAVIATLFLVTIFRLSLYSV